MIFTAKKIDEACRSGLFCWVGNREEILGCVAVHDNQPADKGQGWVNMATDLSWRLVSLTTIVIENPKGANTMPQGKGAPGRVTHIKSKRPSAGSPEPDNSTSSEEVEVTDEERERIRNAATERLKQGGVKLKGEESDGQIILPGQEKKVHSAIVEQAIKLDKAELAAGRARRKVKEERDILTQMMVQSALDQQDLPTGKEALIERDPKAIIRKKKDPKHTRRQPVEDIDAEHENGEEE